ncbi:hypothetical protein OG226_17400 [Streptomyces sp. NBC_01261]|uniref:hypothetical protein n=1 Tax=Streptomyces sp. NBC_01261 TaxID=2903802 RepID=UPI002E30CE45|nr:hypothetical protein [Streptomyces sp. NBC_01261]
MKDEEDLGRDAKEALQRLEAKLPNASANSLRLPVTDFNEVTSVSSILTPTLSQMTPSELNKALHGIDALINASDSLGTSDVKERGMIRQYLTRRRENIILRLWEHTYKKSASSLKELIDNLPDDEQRRLLEAELEDLQRDTFKLQAESRQVIARRERDDAILRAELMERKWEVWSKILARESVATFAGSLLLVGLAVTLIVAMFTKTQTSEIITNSFLIVLGYFFGHSGNSRGSDQ